MQTDSVFVQGESHQICQDYALDMETKLGRRLLIVSDGCSMIRKNNTAIPHPYSDISSRIVAHAAKNAYCEGETEDSIFPSTMINVLESNICTAAHVLSITPKHLSDATLQMVVIDGNNVGLLRMGDGYIIYKYSDLIIVEHVECEPNMPYLVSYMLDEFASNTHSSSVSCKTITNIFQVSKHHKLAPLDYIETSKNGVVMGKHNSVTDKDEIEQIIITSDGLGDICHRKDGRINLEDALTLIFPFKNTRGSFIKRRVLNGMSREMKKRELYFNDDFGMAGVTW